jgi:transposase
VFVAGVDAHTRYVVLVIVDSAAGKVLGPVRIRTHERERLLAALAPYRPLDVVVETSSSWPWLHDVVTGAGGRFVLAHARRLRAIAEANYKSDEVDAELLARMRLAGLIPEVHPSSREQRDWATLLRHRTTLVAERTRLVNRIHAQLHRHGCHLERGRLLTRAGRQQLRATAWPRLTVEERALVRSHWRVIRELQPLVRALDRRIAHVAATIPEARLLTTVPGIGPHRALLLCAEALPLSRYRTPGHLAAYAGLVPRTGQSGQRGVRHGPIPAGANRWLRGALVRAVVSHVQCAPTSWLSAYYTAQKSRVGWPVARIATARKLARVVHAMLRTKTPWSNEPPLGESSTHRMLQARPDSPSL